MSRQDGFEREVRRALRRTDAPPGFANRVEARLAKTRFGEMQRSRSWWARVPFGAPSWAMAFLLVLGLTAGIAGAHRWRLHREEQRAAVAEQQFDEALEVTGQALDRAANRVALQFQQKQMGTVSRLLHSAEKGEHHEGS